MLPFVLISKSETKINHYIDEYIKNNDFSPFSVFRIMPETRNLNLDQIREIRKLIRLTASGIRLIVIYLFDSATPEAQNALLKTLEDPGENQFILTACNEENILGTVRSRAKLIYLDRELLEIDPKNQKKETQEFQNYMDEVINNKSYQFLKSKMIDKLSRENAVKFFDQIIIYFRNKLEDKNLKADKLIKRAFEYKKLLEKNNINPQLAVDHFLIQINQRTFLS